MPRNVSGIYTVPVGTDGVANTTIFSAKYNTYIHDVESDLNTPRPIVAGGTGASDATSALVALGGEKALQQVTNYDTFAFVPGSFWSAVGATSAPTSTARFVGYCVVDGDGTGDTTIVAWPPGTSSNAQYQRKKTSGAWAAWVQVASALSDTDLLYVKKGGDTMTGPLTVSGGNIVTGGSVWAGLGFITQPGQSSVATGHYFNIDWTGPGTPELWIDNVHIGRLAMTADMSATYYPKTGGIVSGNMQVNGDIKCNGGLVYTINPIDPKQGNIMFGNTGIQFYYDGISHFHATTGMSVDAGDFTCAGDVICGLSNANIGVIRFGNNSAKYIYCDGTNYNFDPAGLMVGGGFVSSGVGFSLVQNGVQGQISYITTASPLGFVFQTYCQHNQGVWARYYIDVGGVQFFFQNDGTAAKPGSTTWASTSDARIKNVVGNYEAGLAELETLNPIIYTYKGNDTNVAPKTNTGPDAKEYTEDAPYPNSMHYTMANAGTKFIGLIAQECETVMPELVKSHKGFIDGVEVEDVRLLDPSALTFALINAVKELSARVKALEALP